MVEWWSYLADILTLYNEQIVQQAYLGTVDDTDHPDALRRLVQILGFRPRPGLAATAKLAALINGRGPVTLKRGFQVRSKATPGKPPQIFELDADAVLTSPDAVALDPPPADVTLSGAGSLLLKGTVTALRKGDWVLVVPKTFPTTPNAQLVSVKEVRREKGARGHNNTRVLLDGSLDHLAPKAKPGDYRALYSKQSTYLWHISTAQAVSATTLDLGSMVRQIRPNDLILLFDSSSSSSLPPRPLSVTAYQEVVWYANATDPNDPTKAPPGGIALPIPHSELTIKPSLGTDASTWQSDVASVELRYAWRDAGEIIAPDAATFVSPAELTALYPATVPSPGIRATTDTLLLEDAFAAGAMAVGRPSSDGQKLDVTSMTSLPASGQLKTPLRGLFNLLTASRGATVANELLGRGDATQASQEFVLKKSPLAYMAAPGSNLGYISTLTVTVDGIAWSEAASFYQQPRDARIFVTREDAAAKTYVMFGDGVNGASLPSGAAVIASYRVGSGALAPDAGSLTAIGRPFPGLRAIRNPIPAGGGADPDPSDKIRRYAPRSVLTFGRAVSASDYETIAAQAPGVNRARAYWSWSAERQRNLVKVYVGDDAQAVQSAQTALRGTEDPNRPVEVKPATAVNTGDLIIRVHPVPGVDQGLIKADIDRVLFDDQVGLFGLRNVQIGQAFFASQVIASCMTASGVASALLLNWIPGHEVKPVGGVRFDPGEGQYFTPDLNNRYVQVVPL
jgi:hypothetical protein